MVARGRFISDSIATDARLNSLSVEAELVYLMAIPHLDRDGLIEGDPDVLWGKVCPKRRVFLDGIATFIQEWATAGLVLMYDTDNGPVLWFKGFAKNQTGLRYDRETPSKFPPPPECGVHPAELRQPSGNCRAEVEVKDQVEDQGGEDAAAPPPAPPQTLDDEIEFQTAPPLPERPLTPQQEMYAAICEALGWDYHIITDRNKVRVAQTVKLLTKSGYAVADIRRFMTEIWFADWRWVKHRSYPTLTQLREEIGKTRSVVADVSPPKQKGIQGYRAMLARQGIDL